MRANIFYSIFSSSKHLTTRIGKKWNIFKCFWTLFYFTVQTILKEVAKCACAWPKQAGNIKMACRCEIANVKKVWGVTLLELERKKNRGKKLKCNIHKNIGQRRPNIAYYKSLPNLVFSSGWADKKKTSKENRKTKSV